MQSPWSRLVYFFCIWWLLCRLFCGIKLAWLCLLEQLGHLCLVYLVLLMSAMQNRLDFFWEGVFLLQIHPMLLKVVWKFPKSEELIEFCCIILECLLGNYFQTFQKNLRRLPQFYHTSLDPICILRPPSDHFCWHLSWNSTVHRVRSSLLI